MANILYTNNAAGTLVSGITNVAASLTLNAGQGSAFPSPSNPQVFYVTLTDAATQTLIEIVKVTARAGDVFSITRAQDGTSALSWNAGDIVSHRTIALELRGFENAAEGNFAAQVVPVTPSTTLGIVGTTVSDSANPGSVGEFLGFVGNQLPVASGSTNNAVLGTLQPGDWDVSGVITFIGSGGAAPVSLSGGISLTTNALPTATLSLVQIAATFGANAVQDITAPVTRVNISSPTVIFLSAQPVFSSGTMTVGGAIRARRMR